MNQQQERFTQCFPHFYVIYMFVPNPGNQDMAGAKAQNVKESADISTKAKTDSEEASDGTGTPTAEGYAVIGDNGATYNAAGLAI